MKAWLDALKAGDKVVVVTEGLGGPISEVAAYVVAVTKGYFRVGLTMGSLRTKRFSRRTGRGGGPSGGGSVQSWLRAAE